MDFAFAALAGPPIFICLGNDRHRQPYLYISPPITSEMALEVRQLVVVVNSQCIFASLVETPSA